MLPLKERFDLPQGVIYLDGNSLGPLPRGAVARATEVMTQQWGQELIRAWNTAGWMDLPVRVGDRIAPLIGAVPGTVATGDTLSIKVYQALVAALKLRPDRRLILSDKGNFPSDLYMAQGLIETLDQGYRLLTPDPEDVLNTLSARGEEVAVLMLTHVDYRTGRMHDMAALTQAAQAAGAVVIWDLAHSAGAMALDLTGSKAEFAVGCTYKYLNGGPGAPAFIYARPDLIEAVEPALAGWMGHEAPFAMDPAYRPAMSTERLRVGTPPIVQLAILDAALDAWEGVNLTELRAATMTLSDRFIAEVERRCPALTLASPRDARRRGAQVAFAFEHGYPAMQALIDQGVIGDFRAPDIMRFGFTPLFLDEDDVVAAAAVLERVIADGLYREARFQNRAKVT